jgi:mRNA-degrading endonuclease RelE of RelBE toxin-antitoxin system
VVASGAVHCTIAAREEMEFIELASFTEEVQAVGAEESLQKLQLELLANPEKGDLIQGTGGFRKVRMNLPRRGKSGGARVIYLYLKIQNRILLVDIYKKTDRDTLSHEQKRWLKAFALILKS